MSITPMFPLGGVLLPHMALPLHVFEPRYRRLMHDVRDHTDAFGVALIARGSEVGGGDVRTDVGTMARIMSAEELGDGRWLAVVVGTRRIRIERWLDDAPYPRAEAVAAPSPPAGPAHVEQAAQEIGPRLDRVLALRATLAGDTDPQVYVPDDDPDTACWQAVVMAHLPAIDAQHLLELNDWDDRLSHLGEVLEEQEDVLRFQLSR